MAKQVWVSLDKKHVVSVDVSRKVIGGFSGYSPKVIHSFQESGVEVAKIINSRECNFKYKADAIASAISSFQREVLHNVNVFSIQRDFGVNPQQ